MYKDIKIAYEAGIEKDIEAILSKKCIKRYIKIPNIYAMWGEKMRHMNSHVWPGTDSIILLMTTSEDALLIAEGLKDLKEKLNRENINSPFVATFTNIDEVIENGLIDNCNV